MYDFMVFGYYAEAIGRVFFPSGSEFISLMRTFMTFGAGFLMRPLGALFLGAYIDQHGRRAGLILTLSLMSLGTISIACSPGYATIGIVAPLIIVLGRLIEGFSAGVELGGVSVYLSEIAPPNRRGFYVSWQSASQQLAVVLASLLGVLLAGSLTARQMTAWGWRVPLLAGCAIIPFLFFMRQSLSETDAYLSESKHPGFSEIVQSVRENWQVVVAGFLLALMTTISFYLITTYTPTFGASVLHLGSRRSLIVALCVGLSNFLWLPVMGGVSDRIGRRKLLIGASTLVLLTAYPALLWLVNAPSFMRLLSVELWLSFLYGTYNAGMVVYLTEIMPRSVRTSGFSLAYSLATAFGGFTPLICTLLIHWSGNRAIPGVWLATAAIAALISTYLLRNKQSQFEQVPATSLGELQSYS
jgi:MFS family permease